jgi:hypothetical protein
MSVERLADASGKRTSFDCRIKSLRCAAPGSSPYHFRRVAGKIGASWFAERRECGGDYDISVEDCYFLIQDMTPLRISLVSHPRKAPGRWRFGSFAQIEKETAQCFSMRTRCRPMSNGRWKMLNSTHWPRFLHATLMIWPFISAFGILQSAWEETCPNGNVTGHKRIVIQCSEMI